MLICLDKYRAPHLFIKGFTMKHFLHISSRFVALNRIYVCFSTFSTRASRRHSRCLSGNLNLNFSLRFDLLLFLALYACTLWTFCQCLRWKAVRRCYKWVGRATAQLASQIWRLLFPRRWRPSSVKAFKSA